MFLLVLNVGYDIYIYIYIYIPMDPSTFLGSVWGITYYHLEAFFVPSQIVAMDP